MHRLGHVGRTEIDYDFSWRGRACHSEALVVQNFRDFFLNRFAFESEVDEAGASDVRLLANFCNVADGTSVSLAPTAFPHRAWLVAPQSVALPLQFSQTHIW